MLSIVFSLAQLLLWRPPAGVHLFGSLHFHRPRQSAALGQEAQVNSDLLRGGLGPLAGPLHSRLAFQCGF